MVDRQCPCGHGPQFGTLVRGILKEQPWPFNPSISVWISQRVTREPFVFGSSHGDPQILFSDRVGCSESLDSTATQSSALSSSSHLRLVAIAGTLHLVLQSDSSD